MKIVEYLERVLMDEKMNGSYLDYARRIISKYNNMDIEIKPLNTNHCLFIANNQKECSRSQIQNGQCYDLVVDGGNPIIQNMTKEDLEILYLAMLSEDSPLKGYISRASWVSSSIDYTKSNSSEAEAFKNMVEQLCSSLQTQKQRGEE